MKQFTPVKTAVSRQFNLGALLKLFPILQVATSAFLSGIHLTNRMLELEPVGSDVLKKGLGVGLIQGFSNGDLGPP